VSTEQLSRLLQYPDDDVRAPDVHAIVDLARRRRRRRQAVSLVGAALVPVAAATVVALTGSPASDRTVNPAADRATGTSAPDPSASPSEPSEPSTPPEPSALPAIRRVAPGERVDMGHGWSVWLRGTAVCRSAPTDGGAPQGRYEPFGCRSVTDGNIAGMNLQSSGGPDGTMYSAVIPWDAARVDLVLGGERQSADLVRFEGLPGWTFYYLWATGSHANPGVFAYDEDGTLLGR
jgi:hypothetical protein